MDFITKDIYAKIFSINILGYEIKMFGFWFSRTHIGLSCAGRDQPCAGLCHSVMVRVRVRVTQKNKSQSQDFDFFFKLQSKVITWLFDDLTWLFLKKLLSAQVWGYLEIFLRDVTSRFPILADNFPRIRILEVFLSRILILEAASSSEVILEGWKPRINVNLR